MDRSKSRWDIPGIYLKGSQSRWDIPGIYLDGDIAYAISVSYPKLSIKHTCPTYIPNPTFYLRKIDDLVHPPWHQSAVSPDPFP